MTAFSLVVDGWPLAEIQNVSISFCV